MQAYFSIDEKFDSYKISWLLAILLSSLRTCLSCARTKFNCVEAVIFCAQDMGDNYCDSCRPN
jgi:hypothetical protein